MVGKLFVFCRVGVWFGLYRYVATYSVLKNEFWWSVWHRFLFESEFFFASFLFVYGFAYPF